FPSPTEGGREIRPTLSPVRRGSGTLFPDSADHASATSATAMPMGPTVSRVGQRGKMPAIGSDPQRGFRPTTSQHAEGSRIEHPVSVPSARSQRPAASAAALPLDDPPVVRPGRTGFRTVPYHGLWPVTFHANSGRLAF